MSGGIEEMYREEEENVTNNSVIHTKNNIGDVSIETLKKDLMFQLSFSPFDIEYFIETAERIRELNKTIKNENEYVY